MVVGKKAQTIETLSFINHTECHCVSRHRNLNTRPQAPSSLYSSSVSSIDPNRCKCVKQFDEILLEENIGDSIRLPNKTIRCKCDCLIGNSDCDWLKKGKDGFSIEDRK